MSDTPDPPSSAGKVDGTETSDVIDDQYLGDPEGDVVDGDAVAPSDDISAASGDDTVFASAGSDTIDGGAGRDTYIVGPLLLADPVVTTAAFTADDLSATGYPQDNGLPVALKRFTVETGRATIGDDDEAEASLAGANLFDAAEPVGFEITSLPSLGRLYIDPSIPTNPGIGWREVEIGDTLTTATKLVWVLTDGEAQGLTPDDRTASFDYRVETAFETVTRTADATVTIALPDADPEVDPVLAVAEQSPAFIGGFPGGDPAYDTNFDVEFGPAETVEDGLPDLRASDQAGSQITPVFRIDDFPDYGTLYIDTDPASTLDSWIEVQEDTRFTDTSNLRWVIEVPGPGGVAAALQANATETTFTYIATIAGTDSAPATVAIDLSALTLPEGSLADDVLSSATVVDAGNAGTVLPPGFPLGTADDPVIQFRSFGIDGALDGGLAEADREAAPTLGGLSANDVPLAGLSFRITALPEVGTLFVERDVEGTAQFLEVAQPGFEVRPTDLLHWAATESEATDLPADGQVVFNYVVIDGVGPASPPAVVRVDVLQADPVLTTVDAVPRFDASFRETALSGRDPAFFKAIVVGAEGDATALDGDAAVLEPLDGDAADLAAVSGEFGGDDLFYRVTSLPNVGSLWYDDASEGGLDPEGNLGPGWRQITELDLERSSVVLSPGDRLYWLADYDDFARQGQATVIGNPLDGAGIPQINNIAISDWEDPEFADGSASALRVRFSGRDFDGSPAQVVTLPVDADGNILDPASPDYEALLDSEAAPGLGTPIVKAGMGLAGRSPGAPEVFDDGPVRNNAFYNQVAEINAGFGEFAQASQTLVATLSAPAAGKTLHVSNLYEYEGEYGFAEAFLRGESVARIYFGYRNPFDNSLPPGIQAEIDAGTAIFEELTPQARSGDVLRDEFDQPISFPDDPDGTRPDEGNGLGRFDLTAPDGGPLYFDQLELKSLNSGLLFADPQLSTDTSDFYLHALEVTELQTPDRAQFQYQARDPDGQVTTPTDILIDTNPPIADPVTTNWEASYFNYAPSDPSITPLNSNNGVRGLAYEKIFTVDDLLDGSGLEPGPTVESITQQYTTNAGGDRTVSVLSPVGGNSASLGGTIPTDGPFFYTLDTLPDFGTLMIGTDTNGDGIFQTSEYTFAQEGDTFTAENQLRHVVSARDLADEYIAVDEGGTGLQRGGFADYFSPTLNNRDLLQLGAFRSDQTVEDAFLDTDGDGVVEIGGTFTQLAQDYINRSFGVIGVVAGSPSSDRDPTTGTLEYFNQGFTRGFRLVNKLAYFSDEDSSEGLIFDFEDPVTHAKFRTGGDPRDFFRFDDNPFYAKVDLYLEGDQVGSVFVGAPIADEQLRARYEAERQAAEDAGTPFEPTVPNGIDVFVFAEDLSSSFQTATVFQISNEMLLPDGTRLGAFDTAVVTNEGPVLGTSSTGTSGLQFTGVTFMRGQTSFTYSVTDATTGVKSASQLVTIGTEAGDTVISDPVSTRFGAAPDVPAPAEEAVFSIALTVGGGLDGGLSIPELPNAADLGGQATGAAEGELQFFIKTLPTLGDLYLDVGGDNPDDPTQWQRIESQDLFEFEATRLAFGVTDKIYVVLDDTIEFVTDQDTNDPAFVAIIDSLASPLDREDSGVVAYVQSARQTEALPDSDGFGDNLGYQTLTGVDGGDSDYILGGNDGLVIGGPTSGSGVERGDVVQNFGASDRAVIEFDEVAARATLSIGQLSDDALIQGNAADDFGADGDELGFLTAFRGGEIVGQYYFGFRDPAGEGGPTDHPFLLTSRTGIGTLAELEISVPGLAFDRLEVTAWGFANGARTQVIPNSQGNPETYVPGFRLNSLEYYKLPSVDFEYTVQTPSGQTADSAVSIAPPTRADPDPVRLAVNNAEATIEGDRAVFSVEVLNGATDTDILVTLDIVDQLTYANAFNDNRADENDWTDDLAQNGDPAGNDKIAVLIRAGESRGEASIRINAEGESNIEGREFLSARIASVDKPTGREVLVHDDSGNVEIIEASNAVSVTDISTTFDPAPDPSFLTDSQFGEVLFLTRFGFDGDPNTVSTTALDGEISESLLDRGVSPNSFRIAYDVFPNWGTLYHLEADEGDTQSINVNEVVDGNTFSNAIQFYAVVSRDDELPEEFTSNPRLYQDAGGDNASFDSLADWGVNATLSFTALDETGNAATVSFDFDPGSEGTPGSTQIGVDTGGGDADPALISAGTTPGSSEELRISYEGAADLIWAEIDLDDFATQNSLDAGLYEIAQVTVVHEGTVIATYWVGDGATTGRPDFAVETNGTTSTRDDLFDNRWIEADAEGRFVVGGFDFDEIRLSSVGYNDTDPLNTPDDNPIDSSGVRAGFSVNAISYLRSEDLATGLAPTVTLSYTGWVTGGSPAVGRNDTESPPGTIEIALSGSDVVPPAPTAPDAAPAAPDDSAPAPATPGPATDPVLNNDPISPAAADPPITFETIDVTVDDTGTGSVDKLDEGVTDTLTSVEDFIAAEAEGQIDRITLTTDVAQEDVDTGIAGLSDAAEGTFTPADSTATPIAFGPTQATQLSDLLAQNRPGTYQITGGDEAGRVGNISFSNFEEINFGVVCFARGTHIKTDKGEKRVEDLTDDDLVWTLDRGFQPIRWHGTTCRVAIGKTAPIEIKAGVFRNKRPLRVSRQHRIYFSDSYAELLFGEPEVLVAAHMLEDGERIRRVEGGLIEYHHILLDAHSLVLSEGVLTESFFPGLGGWDLLSPKNRDEICAVFPDIADVGPSAYGPLCRLPLTKEEARVFRHVLREPDGQGPVSKPRLPNSRTPQNPRPTPKPGPEKYEPSARSLPIGVSELS